MADQSMNRKERISERYKGVDPSVLEVIPAKPIDEINVADRTLKVAAYVRVSTENDEQKSSYELQVNDFTDRIKGNPNWEFAGIYSDEGISGTELSHRKGMLQMIEDAKAGKIQHILAKSIARFARNVVDCLSIIDELRNLDPPVGVHFDENNLYTLDSTGSLVLTILATVAEEESRSKSFIMNWSIERRFSRGIFLTPKLLGYDVDENGQLVINPDEAETVKVIYDLYLNGWSPTEIADLLTLYGRKTKLGKDVWNPSTINEVIENERHCGDVRARKTFTPNFKTHKSRKNNRDRKQYIQRDHHQKIVSRDVYNAANLLRSSRAYIQRKRPLPLLSVVDDGILKGYVPLDKDWSGFSSEDYQMASQSVYDETEPDGNLNMPGQENGKKRLALFGYQRVRGQYFSTRDDPTMTITRGKLRFNTACLKKFEDVEYVELLLNTVNNRIAIRPCGKDNSNAIHWGKLRNERWVVSTMSCRGMAKILFDMMQWDDDVSYRFRGQYINNGAERYMLFELDEPEMIKTVERLFTSADTEDRGLNRGEEGLPQMKESDQSEADDQQNSDGDLVLKERVRFYSDEWYDSFGEPVKYLTKVNYLTQHHYAGNWDVLRPAKELSELNMLGSEELLSLEQEAELIIEGWAAQNG